MDEDAKSTYFQTLLKLGYEEIQISCPSSSQAEYDFTRLIDTGAVPEHVWLEVLLPCQGMTLFRTIKAVKGKVILHFHFAKPHYHSPELACRSWAGRLLTSPWEQRAIPASVQAPEPEPGTEMENPYIPIDPNHIGRYDERIIRVNKHSGSGGAIWHIKQTLHIDMPREMQLEFTSVVKDLAIERGFEVPPDTIRYFAKYMRECFTDLHDLGFRHDVTGDGPEVLDKISVAMEQRLGVGFEFEVLEYATQVLEDSRCVYVRPTACFIRGASRRSEKIAWGVGIDEDSAEVVLKAVLSVGYKLDSVFRWSSD